ncbi:hypothetical protein DMUE_4789 [Dictyocoela muelleri]|nr:hypothetical protein DMUE_4789 [Dictyocoela muelleri]
MLFYKNNDKAVNGDEFVDFMIDLNSDVLSEGIKDPIFIMDNARIHHYKKLETIFAEQNIKVLYLPPYSPFLIFIENCFSKWKNHVLRANCQTIEELHFQIQNGFNSITLSYCNGFYRIKVRYLLLCRKK